MHGGAPFLLERGIPSHDADGIGAGAAGDASPGQGFAGGGPHGADADAPESSGVWAAAWLAVRSKTAMTRTR
jgi:hypothetical protein